MLVELGGTKHGVEILILSFIGLYEVVLEGSYGPFYVIVAVN